MLENGFIVVTVELPEEQKMKKPKTFKVVVIEAGKKPVMREIVNSLESFQAVVGGMIQQVPLGTKAYQVFVNEEGILLGLPFNRRRLYDPNNPIRGSHDLFGTILILQFKGMTDEKIEAVIEEWT